MSEGRGARRRPCTAEFGGDVLRSGDRPSDAQRPAVAGARGTLIVMGNHAISLATVGKTAEAAALLATAIESRRTTSSDPRALLVMLANLGDLHVSLERWVVAEASLRESIELPYARRACVVVLRASLAVSDCLLFTEAVSEEGRRQPSVSEFDRNNDEG